MPALAAHLSRHWFKYLLSLVALADLTLAVAAHFRPDGLEHIYFFDVGQGDASLIKTATNQFILIDGGPTDQTVHLLDNVLPMWHRRLDLVILTHPHADHATGLLAVMDRYFVAQFWYTGAAYDSETYQTLLDKIAARHIPVQLANRSDYLAVGQTQLRVLFPITEQPTSPDLNETSIVNTVEYGHFTALFTGDASVNNEKVIRPTLPDADVLKVPHHGSHNSSSAAFVNATKPETAVIMVGAGNPFGHPHLDILERYQSAGARVYRTDQDGTVEVITDGTRYRVVTHPN